MKDIENLIQNNKQTSFKWLILAATSLAFSGLFAVFLVIARSPKIHTLLPYENFFKTTLTIHVNLSVLVWLLSFGTFYISVSSAKKLLTEKFAFACSTIGMLIIALSIFDNSASAYLNNYVPYLDSKIFSAGILIFLFGIFLISFEDLLKMRSFKLTTSNLLSAIIISAFIVLLLTFQKLSSPENINLYNNADYYEILYWGFGHMLQFAYSLAMLISWFLVIEFYQIKILKNQSLQNYLNKKALLFHSFLAIIGVLIILKYNVTDFEYKRYFTLQMALFGGITFMIILVNNYSNIISAIKQKSHPYIKNAFLWSLILFLAGGIISLTIHGSDTRIPAHYHGSIVGVSLGLIAAFYIFLEKFGYKINMQKSAKIQPVIYGAGQLIHILGLAISGGYGALRKNPGVAESFEGKFYMGLMGFGGLLSIIGGLIFVIVIFNSILKTK